MAYCKKCGAYIPDGLSACLACGYDEAAEARKDGSAYAYEKEQNEDFRLKYEEERRRRQEDNRRWAEQERQRRQEEAERRKQEEEERQRREAEEFRARQEAEQQARARSYAYRAASSVGSSQGAGRIFSALSYLSILWILPRIFNRDDEFSMYHSRQGLTLFVFSILSDAVNAFVPGVGWILSLFRLYCIYKGMTNALNNRMEPLPYIGQYGEKK